METDHEEFGRQQLDSQSFEPPYDPEAELHDELGKRIEALSTECDGLFLIIDTAKHIGARPTAEEISGHIRTCPECHEVNSDFLDG